MEKKDIETREQPMLARLRKLNWQRLDEKERNYLKGRFVAQNNTSSGKKGTNRIESKKEIAFEGVKKTSNVLFNTYTIKLATKFWISSNIYLLIPGVRGNRRSKDFSKKNLKKKQFEA